MTNKILDYWYKRELLQPKGFPFVDEKKEERNRKNLNGRVKSYRYAHTLCRNGQFLASIPEILHEDELRGKNTLTVIDNEMDVCVGNISKEPLIAGLFKALNEKDTRQETERGTVCLFAFRTSCDEETQYVENSFTLSPFVWGVSRIAQKKCIQTEDYKLANEDEEIISILNKTDTTIENKITAVYRLLHKKYLIFTDIEYDINDLAVSFFYSRFANKHIALQEQDSIQHEGDLRSSFILEDIEMLMTQSGHCGKFTQYVTVLQAPEKKRKDIRLDYETLSQTLDISKYPLGKWPSKHRPSLMQQVAINLALSSGEPVFSINGPPGTGKTSLLKEIVADRIVTRAITMLEFTTPDEAFEKQKILSAPAVSCNYLTNWYEPVNKLLGYEMLVASCNNGAVENISKELPDYETMYSQTAEKEYASCFDLDKTQDTLTFSKYAKENTVPDIYFSLQASELLSGISDSQSAWGLVSVPLGNRGNIAKFLSAAAGILLYKSDVAIERELTSGSFSKAQKEFRAQYELVKSLQSDLRKYRDFCLERERRQKNIPNLLSTLDASIRETEKKCKSLLAEAQEKKESVRTEYDSLRQKQKEQETAVQCENADKKEIFDLEARLHFWEKLLYKFLHTETIEYLREKRKSLEEVRRSIVVLKQEFSSSLAQKEKLEIELAKIRSLVLTEEQTLNRQQGEKTALLNEQDSYARNLAIEAQRRGLSEVLPFDEKTMGAFIGKDAEVHVSNPWTTERFDVEREKLFYLAMKLHKYFVLSSKCVRDNLKLFAHVMGKKSEKFQDISFTATQRESFFAAIFQSLFLFTPVISTTFASVQTMLRDIKKPEKIGLLIVDEAGQAAPQMVAGTLFRSQRTVIVGDPKQIEPVVTFPDVFNHFFLKSDSSDKTESSAIEILKKYTLKSESVQTFADRMNPYGSYLTDATGGGQEWIGCPLTVHRRCISPLFDISNALSYDGSMIQKTAAPSAGNCFFGEKSQWLSVTGSEKGNKNHFVREQGEYILSVIGSRVRNDGEEIPVFIISPFVSVVEEMKKLLKSENFDSFVQCGTVHTFQGKETNEVFLLLGCDERSSGAVRWVNSNLINVAVTRARYRLYVVGDKTLWCNFNRHMELINHFLA